MRGYCSSTDNPICFLPDEVYAAYPEAKYILTIRPDGKNGWWRSIMEAAGWHTRRDFGRYLFRFLIWPVGFLRRTDDKVQDIHGLCRQRYGGFDAELYDKHNAHVRDLVPEGQLLVYDVREGWDPLCKFLQVPVPGEEFPRLNETGAMQRIYLGMMMFGAFHWVMYAAGATAMAYLATKPETIAGLLSGSQDLVLAGLQRSGLR